MSFSFRLISSRSFLLSLLSRNILIAASIESAALFSSIAIIYAFETSAPPSAIDHSDSISLNASDTVNPYRVIIASAFNRLNWPLPAGVNSCVSDKVTWINLGLKSSHARCTRLATFYCIYLSDFRAGRKYGIQRVLCDLDIIVPRHCVSSCWNFNLSEDLSHV